MKKKNSILLAFVLLALAVLIGFPDNSNARTMEPGITDTWDAELQFCHGEPTDCYEMIEATN